MSAFPTCNIDVVGKRQLNERARDKYIPVKIAIRFVWSSIDTDALLKRLVRHGMNESLPQSPYLDEYFATSPIGWITHESI